VAHFSVEKPAQFRVKANKSSKEAHRRYDLGAIGYLNDKIVDYFKEDGGANPCLQGIICR
jgi:hypothetical protein